MPPPGSLLVPKRLVRLGAPVGRRQVNSICVIRFQSSLQFNLVALIDGYGVEGAGTTSVPAGSGGGLMAGGKTISCCLHLTIVYEWNQFSGLKTVAKTSKTLESCPTEVNKTLVEKTPMPDEALGSFR